MSDTDSVLRAIEAWRAETHRATAELRSEVRSGFQRVEDTLRVNEGRVSRHSERFRALDRKPIGDVSGGYRTRGKHERAPLPAWVRYAVIPAASAAATLLATKGLPPLVHLLAEILK